MIINLFIIIKKQSETADWLTEMLDAIDDLIFGHAEAPPLISDDILNECLIWKKKFSHGTVS